jgi:D-lactate dehydrogenase (cytochrome)
VIHEASAQGKTVTVSGARTGICGGAVPSGGFLISLEKMCDVLGIEQNHGRFELTVESGLRLNELTQMLRSKDFAVESPVLDAFRKSGKAYFYPPDPTETSATVGGTIATNASGARTLHYGATRNYVVELEVVLSTGELLHIRRGDIIPKNGVFSIQKERGRPLVIPAPQYTIPKTKHSAGIYSSGSMDLIDLFIGSEGILGIIGNATLLLIEEPPGIFGGAAFFPSEDEAFEFVMNGRKNMPLALEYFDGRSLELLRRMRSEEGPISEIPEIPAAQACVYFESAYGDRAPLNGSVRSWSRLIDDCGGNSNTAWGALTRRDQSRLKSFRHALPESINKIIAMKKRSDDRIHKVGTDMAVPDKYLKEIMAFYRSSLSKERIQHVIFGHVGNNHLHVNMIPSSFEQLVRAKELYRGFARRAVELGGSVSAEHGIGKLKREFMKIQYQDDALNQMRTIKELLDPGHMLNPGDVL